MFRSPKKMSTQALIEKELAQAKEKQGVSQLADWQQALGNRVFGRWLNKHGNEETPLQTQLDHGRPLDAGTRSRMEQSLGADLADVRVHTDSTAANLAHQHNAAAFAAGTDVGFASDNYRPGTPAGDALLAHELAHVVQHKRHVEALQNMPSAALEGEADRTAGSVVSGLWSSLHGAVSSVKTRASRTRSQMQGGMRLQFFACSGEKEIQPPSFLGARSLETWNTIKIRLESGEALQNMLVVGPLLVLLTSKPAETLAGGGYPLEEQVRAVQAVPVIVRNRVQQDISLLLVMHGDELTDEERRYWERWLDRLNRVGRIGPEEE